MVRELAMTPWKTYSGSKAAHDEWKQNDKQQQGLLKLLFAKQKLLQHRQERAAHACPMLIFSSYSSSRSIWVLPRDLESPCASHLYQASCSHPNPRRRRKASYCLNIRDPFLGRHGWALHGIHRYVFSLQKPSSYLKSQVLACQKDCEEQPVPNQELMDSAE